jgi:hypothetical protein
MDSAYLNPALIANANPTPDLSQNSPINLAEGVAKVQQLQQQAAQQAALAPIAQQQAQATLQGTQTANQKAQQDLQDQQAFGAAIRDSGGDPDKLVELANRTITDPWVLSRVENMASQMKARNAETSAKQDAATATLHGQYAGKFQSVIDAINSGDTEGALKLWTPAATQALAEKDPTGKQTMPPGTIDPSTLPSVAALQNYQTYLSGSKDYLAQQAKIKEQNALAAANAAKATVAQRQSEREDIADMYNGVQTPEDHAAFIAQVQKKYPDLAGEYANLPFDPDNTPDQVERMALTPQQRRQAATAEAVAEARQTTANAAMARANVSGGRAGLFARANDPTLTDAQRAANQAALDQYDKSGGGVSANAQLLQQRYMQRRSDNDTKLHSTLQQQEQDQWTLAGRYGDVLKQAGVSGDTSNPDALNQTIKDPKTGRDITASEALQLQRGAQAKAGEFAKQATEIRKREQWGEFAPKQAPAPAAPGANPAAAPTTGAPVKKTFPRANLPGFAAANKMTPQQAEQQLRSQGYQLQ